jgi:hypothetical protein
MEEDSRVLFEDIVLLFARGNNVRIAGNTAEIPTRNLKM